MCLSLLAWQCHPRYPSIIAHNRDEFISRPSESAHFWKEDPLLLAGKDLKSGGTWLGITKTDHFALVTNIRMGKNNEPKPRSRGNLVRDYLTGELPAREYLNNVQSTVVEYGPFNLILGSTLELHYLSSLEGYRQLQKGVYGISNHLLDTPWPKLVRGKKKFQELTKKRDVKVESLFELMLDTTIAPDGELPDTGAGLELERALSPIFISGTSYGTRSTTVILVSDKGHRVFVEKTYEGQKTEQSEKQFEFELTASGV